MNFQEPIRALGPTRALACVLAVLLLLSLMGCGNSLLLPSSSAPSMAERVGTPYTPADQVPIVYNPITGAYEARPIPGVSIPTTPPPNITYTGISN